MLDESLFLGIADRAYDFCEYPAVRHRLLQLMGKAEGNADFARLREQFLTCDIVEELYREQDMEGGWGNLRSKDYSKKTVFPTSEVAIDRCLYIGLTYDDRDILMLAYDYLESFLLGTSREKFQHKNERAVPWLEAEICTYLEAVKPHNPLCDKTVSVWKYIAGRAYESGEYSYEKERDAQHEVFLTREARLVPMQIGLLLKRRDELPPGLESAMLRHHGETAYHHGYFWAECPEKLPDEFVGRKTRRWFHSFNFINQFTGSSLYLSDAVEWLLDNRNADGLWDYGPQVKDPWGYFGYFSKTRKYSHNRVVDCTMEILSFLRTYLDHNPQQENVTASRDASCGTVTNKIV